MKIIFLYPCDFFDRKKPDIDYESEYNVACQFSEFEVVLYHYDEFVSDNILRLYPHLIKGNKCIYRGWMLKPSQYKEMYYKLMNKGIQLINSLDQYEKLHIFPNIYPLIQNYTPKILYYEDIENIEWECVNHQFKRFMIKDYVKSVKGTKFPLYFETPIDQEIINNYIKEFIALRNNLFTQGIVIKEFVELKKYNSTTNEFRAFYMKNQLITLSRNSNQPEGCPIISLDFVEQFKTLGSNYYTIDFAELESGEWIIIETGDGQVSGLSPNQYVFKYYDEMKRVLIG